MGYAGDEIRLGGEAKIPRCLVKKEKRTGRLICGR